jgi:hypothetical protein
MSLTATRRLNVVAIIRRHLQPGWGKQRDYGTEIDDALWTFCNQRAPALLRFSYPGERSVERDPPPPAV